MSEQDKLKDHKVGVDDQNHYTIVRIDSKLPLGMKETGFTGTMLECMDYIKKAKNAWQPEQPHIPTPDEVRLRWEQQQSTKKS